MKFYCLLSVLFFWGGDIHSKVPKILFKMATRERPQKFLKTLDRYYELMSKKYPFEFIISCDLDDKTMNNKKIQKKLQKYEKLRIFYANNKDKVAAINNDIGCCNDFDILVVTSDDMIPVQKGYDKIIVEKMVEEFPDFDGVIDFNDGFMDSVLVTLPILGSKYYDRFKYVYYPDYDAFCCDVEFTLVAKIIGKYRYSNDLLIRHEHPGNGFNVWDDLYFRYNKADILQRDTDLLHKRKALHFGISSAECGNIFLSNSFDLFGREEESFLWSILICSLEGRKKRFVPLYTKLLKQLQKYGVTKKVEVVFCRDDKEYSIGYKRNMLIENSKGKYISFIDDDDDISDDYVKEILSKLIKDPDCVSLNGVITFDGKNPKTFIHSIKYNSYFEKNNIYYRPPNHLNPIKRSLIEKFKFPAKNHGEDTDWAMQICKSGVLKIEEKVVKPYYFYLYEGKK